MLFTVLGSGSKGNCVYVEDEETALFIDAGFSYKEICRRLTGCGRDTSKIKALCLTHEHGDHISGAGVVSRKLQIPVYANHRTLKGQGERLGKLYDRHEFTTGDSFDIGSLCVRTFCISHDTEDPVGYIISNRKHAVGYLTDTGKTSHLMLRRLSVCDALVLEFNHDLKMLKNGPYPPALQQRVRSSKGHLCNDDAAAFLQQVQRAGRLRHVVLAHISAQNNTPELAEKAARAVAGEKITIYTASQDKALPVISI